MNDLYLAAFMLLLGFALSFVILPRNKTINVSDDYIESQKTKDNSKVKNRKRFFGFLKRDAVKKMERQNRATDKRMKRLKDKALRNKK